MKLILIGHENAYQLQSLLAMFFPLEKQETLIASGTEQVADLLSPDQNIWQVVAAVDAVALKANVSVLFHGQADSATQQLEQADKPQINNALCGMVYQILQKRTGIALPYGIYTGIRPVKTVNTWRAEGLTDAQISARLQNEFFVQEDKIQLALKTADLQREMLAADYRNHYSLFVFIPFCPTRCNYCSFVSETIAHSQALIEPYVEALCRDLKVTAKAAKEMGLTLDSVYIGGGTPTSLPPHLLAKVMGVIAKEYPLLPQTEYTVEAGRPDTITKEHLKVILAGGGNRISINPQTFCDETLKRIGRNHSAYQVLKAYALAREIGIPQINMDLIAALPGETIATFEKSLQTAISLKPENLTVHTLTLKRAAALRTALDADPLQELARRNEATGMLHVASDLLPRADYAPYYLYRQKNTVGTLENVGWTKPGFACRYNVLIMEECEHILACGANASSKLLQKPDGAKLFRIFQDKYPYEYIKRIDKILATKQQFPVYLLHGLPSNAADKTPKDGGIA